MIIENEKVTGSLSLQGAIFDDLSFKKYKKDLKSEENVIFLNPKKTEDGYYIETGWTSVGNKVKVPSLESLWSVKGNKVLNEKNNVVLEWNNGEGLIFKKIITLDDKYLFRVKQEVTNNTNEYKSLPICTNNKK